MQTKRSNSMEFSSKKMKKTVFIADIAANHDGSLQKAIDLVHEVAEAGANAVKFQHFTASTLISREAFEAIGKISHQEAWADPVDKVYQKYSLPYDWSNSLLKEANKANVDLMTTPYNFEAVGRLSPYVSAFKIGSGDITYIDLIARVVEENKYTYLATGASNLNEVIRAVDILKRCKAGHCIMQCNTNYSGSIENFKYISLRVISLYKRLFPQADVGLSDHTPGHTTALGAIALGATAVEKHFTLDNTLNGPDHQFSMTPNTWKEMVDRARELELAMGSSEDKVVEENEKESIVVQRRALVVNKSLPVGHILNSEDIEILRPCPQGAFEAYSKLDLIGKRLLEPKTCGSHLYPSDIDVNI